MMTLRISTISSSTVFTSVLYLPKNNILAKCNVEVNNVNGLIVIILKVAMVSVAKEQHFI